MSKKEETSPALKRSWFQELKGEFAKITWPAKEKLVKQSTAVIIISIILGFIIAGVDYLLQIGLTYIVG
ncbi:MAG: preprotein translocase subunit SecE [Wujia sp.]